MSLIGTIASRAALVALISLESALFAQRTPMPVQAAQAADAPRYAAVADRVLRSPMIIDSTIRRVERLKGAEAIGAAPGQARLYVQADLVGLVRGTDSVPPRIGYILDVPTDSRGRIPNIKKQRVLLYARAVPGKPGQVQLTGLDSQQPWTPALDAMTRRIAAEAEARDVPPRITGIGNAFHVPGSLPGEGETQIFLMTADGRPVSLTILRRPGEQPRWAVALSEIVDEAAAPPARDTLLWYRLACGLPAQLPATSLRAMDEANGAAARQDYQLVLTALGKCDRG